MVARKQAIISSHDHLSYSTNEYILIGCDLRYLNSLERSLIQAGIKQDTPTLLIAEVVLTYIKPKWYECTLAHPFSISLHLSLYSSSFLSHFNCLSIPHPFSILLHLSLSLILFLFRFYFLSSFYLNFYFPRIVLMLLLIGVLSTFQMLFLLLMNKSIHLMDSDKSCQ